MSLKDKLSVESCYTEIEAGDREEALQIVADKLYELGLVTEEYGEHVILREQYYPTGLPVDGCKIAIPHTDAEYVKETRIAVAVLKHPVDFQVMGGFGEEEIPVHIILMLAIKEQKAQLDVLQELIQGVIQNQVLLKKLMEARNGEEVYQQMMKYLP